MVSLAIGETSSDVYFTNSLKYPIFVNWPPILRKIAPIKKFINSELLFILLKLSSEKWLNEYMKEIMVLAIKKIPMIIKIGPIILRIFLILT